MKSIIFITGNERKIREARSSCDLFDINVEPNNKFLANGILSHNSGTVQEEACIFGVPALTIRESTERQETIECGSNILCGTKTESIINAFNAVMKRKNIWYIPEDYLVANVSDTVINILLGKT